MTGFSSVGKDHFYLKNWIKQLNFVTWKVSTGNLFWKSFEIYPYNTVLSDYII